MLYPERIQTAQLGFERGTIVIQDEMAVLASIHIGKVLCAQFTGEKRLCAAGVLQGPALFFRQRTAFAVLGGQAEIGGDRPQRPGYWRWSSSK